VGESATRANGHDAVLRFEHIAIAGDDQRILAIGNSQHGLEPPQCAVAAPVLGEFDRRAQQIALMLVELRFEAFEEGERVGRATGKAGEDLPLMNAPNLARAGLDHDVAERHLPVAAHGNTTCRGELTESSCHDTAPCELLLVCLSVSPNSWRERFRRRPSGRRRGTTRQAGSWVTEGDLSARPSDRRQHVEQGPGTEEVHARHRRAVDQHRIVGRSVRQQIAETGTP
jgi:hypothetical protein